MSAKELVDKAVAANHNKLHVSVGSIVWMDFRSWKWPDLPHANEDIAFYAETEDDEHVTLRADNFGLQPNYGNGAIYAKKKDTFPAKTNHELQL